jgi:hypothetical protein
MQTDNFKGAELIDLPKGFRAAGVSAGIKGNGKKDMAMLLSDLPAAMAGAFTTNRCAAAPVQLCRRHLKQKVGRAIVVNRESPMRPPESRVLQMRSRWRSRLAVCWESTPSRSSYAQPAVSGRGCRWTSYRPA